MAPMRLGAMIRERCHLLGGREVNRSPCGGGQVGDADARMVVMSEPAQPITLTIPPHVAA